MTNASLQLKSSSRSGTYCHVSPSACGHINHDETNNEIQVKKAFLNALTRLFDQTQDSGADRYYENLSPYFYSSIVPRGRTLSGADCAQQLMSGAYDPLYTIPTAEMHFTIDNAQLVSSFLKTAAKGKNISMVSLGCGPVTSIVNKDLLLVKEIIPDEYVSVDINYKQARQAVSQINDSAPNVKTEFLAQDFTKLMNLPTNVKNFVFMTFLGGTIAQYTCTDFSFPDEKRSSPLKALLQNFGKSTNFKAALMATFDTVSTPGETLRRYLGEGMNSLIDTFWATVKEVTGDKDFASCAMVYQPEFDKETNSVQFVCRAKKETSITVKGKKYPIRKNDEFVIGCSQKMTPEQAAPICEKAGWRVIDLPFKSTRSTTTSTKAIMLVGKNVANI